MKKEEAVSLAEGLWWVGAGADSGVLQCNPYLLMQGGSAVLFDPGSVLDADVVMDKIRSFIPIEQIEAIVLSHQDPDLCSALPVFEKNGFSGVICCHQRTAMLVKYYGISSEFYTIDTHKYRYRLKDTSEIRFLLAPYLHFPGAIMTYLPNLKTLISGDLFGAVTKRWTLIADDDYRESMKTFHESYMPSHEILESVMSQLLLFDIDTICPQHGSVITQHAREHIEILRDLPCGVMMNPVRTKLMDAGGYTSLCTEVIRRYIAMFGKKEVREVFHESPFSIDYQNKTVSSSTLEDRDIWEEFFNLVLKKKGLSWLTVLSPLVEQFSRAYSIPLPKPYTSLIFDAHKNQDIMNVRLQELENEKIDVETRLRRIESDQILCPITGLYNQDFFERYMLDALVRYNEEHRDFAVMFLSIDNLEEINIRFGSDEGDTAMRNLAYILKQDLATADQTFRLKGGMFALFLSYLDQPAAVKRALELKSTVRDSSLFIIPISVSIGMYHSIELQTESPENPADLRMTVLQAAQFRLKAGQRKGRDSLVYEQDQEISTRALYTVLLVDKPGLQRDIIKRALQQERYRVETVPDGLAALNFIQDQLPDIIISELMTPKMGALALCREVNKLYRDKRIPFILLAGKKSENVVKRAIGLGITYMLSHPVMLAELVGIIGILTDRMQSGEEQ